VGDLETNRDVNRMLKIEINWVVSVRQERGEREQKNGTQDCSESETNSICEPNKSENEGTTYTHSTSNQQ